MSDDQHTHVDGLTRRDFVKRSAVATAGATAGLMASGNFAYADGTDTIRLGLVGCGGRGTGAAHDSYRSADGVELVAMGDLFQDRMEESKKQLRERLGDSFKVDRDHTFLGFDAYQKVLDSDVDLVIFATPPAFRPIHLRAAVEAGTHVFVEKPVATDTAGIRSVMESAERAEEKGLAIVAGTQRRHDPAYQEAMRRIHDGAIGEVKTAQVYWNQGGLWHHEREPGMSDMEWQVRNWLYFTWLSGDHIVEQHVHNIDVADARSAPIPRTGTSSTTSASSFSTRAERASTACAASRREPRPGSASTSSGRKGPATGTRRSRGRRPGRTRART
jgi:predicted dehydrogenase